MAHLDEIKTLGVLGAGQMGAGIAQVAAGAGFDVVPTDCLAAHVARLLPSATHLAIAFSAGTRMSRGTALTAIEHAHGGGLVRREGNLVRVPSGWRSRRIDFGPELGARTAITIPWGYVAVPLAVRAALRASRALGALLATGAG